MMNETNNMQVNEQNKQGGISMLTKMKKQLKNEKGLTLVELLAVIVIIAIIAAIAIPAIGNIITNSKYNAVKADALNVLNGAQMYYLDNPGDTNSVAVSKLKEEGYLENEGSMILISSDSTDSVEASVSNTGSGLTLSTSGTIPYSAKHTVKFTGATIADINADSKKGSVKATPTTNNDKVIITVAK